MNKQKMAAAARSAAPHDATGAAPQATTGNAPHAAPRDAFDLLGKVRIILTSGDKRATGVLADFIEVLSDHLNRHSAVQEPAPDAAPLMARNDESQPAAVPDWVYETPGEDYEYELGMWLGGGAQGGFSEQSVTVTREEYIALKRCLAEMRDMIAEV